MSKFNRIADGDIRDVDRIKVDGGASAGGEVPVPIATLKNVLGGGTAVTDRLDFLEKNLALNTLRDVVNAGWSVTEMIDGIADEYSDETGIDAGASSNNTYNAAGDYYAPTNDAANLLLHCDGTDGSTTFTDSAGSKTVTAVGDAQIDTAESKFGGASGLFDGTGDELTVPDSAEWDFGSGDFTVDCWIRPTVSGNQGIIGQYGSSQRAWQIFQFGTTLRFQWTTDGSTQQLLDGGTLALNTWQHIAVVRNGTTLSSYIDGVEVATVSNSDTFFASSALLRIGSENGSSFFNGHLDEIRLLKGTAAWVTDFTPPASAYILGVSDMVLNSITFTANATATNARGVFLVDPVDTVVINTDLIVAFSADGGSTWNDAVLDYEADFDSTIQVWTTSDTTINTSGVSMEYRVTTANNKNLNVHGAYLQWR